MITLLKILTYLLSFVWVTLLLLVENKVSWVFSGIIMAAILIFTVVVSDLQEYKRYEQRDPRDGWRPGD